MNERIKEIALKCYNPYSNFDHEKFAELIIAECANVADKYVADGDVDIAKIIKRHFGVEEQSVCEHEWYSAKNPVVQNGSVCVKCYAIDPREPEELKNERTIN